MSTPEGLATADVVAAHAEGGSGGPPDPSTTYYDRPVIKEPVWIWSVPVYFYVGGVAAGSALLGALAQLADREGLDDLITWCRRLATGGTVVGGGLLIHDLGRPSRFFNMLRVFRPSSAMSVGSWTLAVTSTFAGASAVLPLTGTRAGRVAGDAAGLAAGVMAPALATYTGVLLSDTAIPVWQATRRELPAQFAASALQATSSALNVLPMSDRAHAITDRLGTIATAAEIATGKALERAADRTERVGRPLHEGVSGSLWKASKVLTGASLITSLLPVPQRWHRARRLVSSVCGGLGSLTMRFAITRAGHASARDPRATFEQQRAGRGGAEITGGSAVTGHGDQRAVTT